MADIQHYERVLKKKKGVLTSRFILILIYLFIFSVWFVLTVRFGLHIAVVVLAPTSIVIAVLLTWKYTKVEYEYSFVAGNFTFSRIYGSKKRKAVFEAELKTLVSVIPYSNVKFSPKDDSATLINAVPDNSSPNPCICLFEDGDGKRYHIIIDCDGMTARILRFFKASAVDHAVFDRISSDDSKEDLYA